MTNTLSSAFRFGGKDDAFKALLLSTLFFNFICGSLLPLFANSLIQIVFAFGVLLAYRKQKLNLLGHFKAHYPIAFWLFTAWIAWTFFSCVRVLLFDNELKSQMALAAIRQFYFITAICFVIAMVKFMHITSLSYRTVFNAMMGGLLFTLVYLLLSFHFGPTPDSLIWFLGLPLMGHIRVLSSVGGAIAIICTVQLLLETRHSIGRQWIYFLALTATWSAIFWSGGRTGMTAAFLSTLVLSGYSIVFKSTSIQRLGCLVLALAAAAFIANAFSVFDWNGLGRTVNTIKSVSHEPAAIAAQSTGRAYMWEVSIKAALAHPLFGLGPGGYIFIPEKPFGTDPHNFVIQFLVEWGFVGTFLALSVMLLALFHGLKQLPAAFREKDTLYITGAGIVLVLSLYGITGSAYFHLQPLLYLLVGYSIFPFSRPALLPARSE